MEIQPFETAEAHDYPTIRQQSVFVENRVGQLMRLTRLFDQSETRILAMSIVYSVDCAICRMIPDDPDVAYDALSEAGFQVSETELIVVSLPPGKRALFRVWAALLGGEINIHYVYPLLIQPKGCAALAVLPDNVDRAIELLRSRNFDILDQADLLAERHH